MDEVLFNKAQSMERCLKRLAEEYQQNPDNLHNDITRQDSILLNLQRLCEICIDSAMYLVRKRKLGIPQESREAFQLLAAEGILSQDLSLRLQKMVGFRNLAVHEYQNVNLEIVDHILQERLGDFKAWIGLILQGEIKN